MVDNCGQDQRDANSVERAEERRTACCDKRERVGK